MLELLKMESAFLVKAESCIFEAQNTQVRLTARRNYKVAWQEF